MLGWWNDTDTKRVYGRWHPLLQKATEPALQALAGGMDDQVHVFHRHRAQQHGVTAHQRPHKTGAALISHPHRPHIGHLHHPAIGHGDLPQRFLLQLELHHHMLRNAEHQGTRVRQGDHLQGVKLGLPLTTSCTAPADAAGDRRAPTPPSPPPSARHGATRRGHGVLSLPGWWPHRDR